MSGILALWQIVPDSEMNLKLFEKENEMNSYLASRIHQPRKQIAFWCNRCDRVSVNSDKPETGKFFIVHGHTFNLQSKDYDNEEYKGVMFALCNPCANETD